jgi:hypothetical protein
MRAAAEKLGQLHEQQAQAPCKLVPMELVAWDGVERPTRGFSDSQATSDDTDENRPSEQAQRLASGVPQAVIAAQPHPSLSQV